MLEIVRSSIIAAQATITEGVPQPFTKELLDLHKYVLEEQEPRSIAYKTKREFGRRAVHRTMDGVILESCVIFPVKGVITPNTSLRLGVAEPLGPMYLELPLGKLADIDMAGDPFAAMIADYFRAHVEADDQLVIASSF